MSKERMVQVTREEYENLIRDQHTVELLTEYIQQDQTSDPMLCLLLGIQKPEHLQLPDPEKNYQEGPKEMKEPAVTLGEITERTLKEDPASPPAEPEKKSGRKKIDRGKVMALHNAGWTNKKIADEMTCSEASVSMILKEMLEEK